MAGALPSPVSLDDDTAQAVQVLALAVQRERVPGIVEFVVASDALARAATSRDRTDLDYATVAFDSLDPTFRGRIVDCAYELARSERSRLRMPQIPQPVELLSADCVIEPDALPPEAAAQGAGRARNRLMTDLGRRPGRRAAESNGDAELAPTLDEIIPIQPARFDGPPPKWWE